MSKRATLELAQDSLIPLMMQERERQTVLRDWARGKHVAPFKPREANPELDALLEKAPVPLIMLIIRILSQSMEIQGYAPGVERLKDRLWQIWTGNQMATRQKRLYKAALWGGQAFAMSLPGDPVPKTRIFSGRNMVALYQDPEADEWPQYAGFLEVASRSKFHFTVVDDEKLHRMQINPDGSKAEYIEEQVHGTGILPVVRYAGDIDDEGSVMGEVEPLIPIQSNIDQTNFDRLLTQSFASWVIRYITGMAKPETDEDAARAKTVLERDRLLLIENPEAKVGTLEGTALNGYIEARRDSKQDLAATAQVSQKTVLGAQSNNADGAEAQAAEEASTQRKIHDYETAFGEAHKQHFRLVGMQDGLAEAWTDYAGEIDWVNSEIRSLSQVADAYGKLATQLHIPEQGLWEMVPGVTPDKAKKWAEMRAADPLAQMGRLIQADVAQ
ncbi:phage portal protein [Microbacterium sp. MMO-10]|uniref:phage portal protein n=1 Tax=Microbacterium sp. MMO-10 TaxID=3081272 RepID=UPI003019290F